MSKVVSNWLVEENLDNTEYYFKSRLEAFIVVRKMEHGRAAYGNSATLLAHSHKPHLKSSTRDRALFTADLEQAHGF